MSDNITTSTPHMHYQGTRDTTPRKIKRGNENLPFHRPFFLTFARKGEIVPKLIDPLEAEKEYGVDLTDVNSEFASQTTPYIKTAVESRAKIYIQRVKPKDARPPATQATSLEVVEYSVPDYKRNSDGTFELDKTGTPIPTGKTNTGLLGRFVIEELGDGVALGARSIKPGTLKGDSGKVSRIIPLWDGQVADFGSDGNNYGTRFWAPTTRSSSGQVNLELLEELDSYPYNLSLLYRPNERTTPSPVFTIYENATVQFSLKPDSIARNLGGMLLDMSAIVGNNWSEDTDAYYTRSPVKDFVVYQDNIDAILSEIYKNEKTFSTIDFEEENKYRINLLGATTATGIPYYTFALSGPLNGDISLSDSSTHYFKGGDDGTVGFDAMNEVMEEFLTTFRVNDIAIDRFALYPFNAVWDCGFSMAVKEKMSRLMSLNHTFVGWTTQDILRSQNTIQVDDSIGLALVTMAQQYPDSVEFKTPPFRGNIVSGSGEWVGSRKKVIVPLNLDRFKKWCMYGRLDSGALDSAEAFDDDEKKIITEVRNMTGLDRDFRSKRRTWENGINYPEVWDVRRGFWAGYKTIYTEPTSTLTSEIIAMIIANIPRICFEVWRSLTANGKLSREQLVERSNRMIRQRTSIMTDGRCTIVPDSQITDGDALRGYSWSTPINLYADGMPTVMDAFVVAYRAEELK